MPTNRKRISRTRAGVEPWMKEFLLHGKVQHSKHPERESILPYCRLKGRSGCFTDPEVWRPVWEELKAEILPVWRREHLGKLCWAEAELLK